MRKLIAIAILLAVATSVYAQTRSVTGQGIPPYRMTKGARLNPVVWTVPTNAGAIQYIPKDKVGTVRWTIGYFPISGYISDVYMITGGGSGADSFKTADTASAQAYKVTITKTGGDTLGARTTVGPAAVYKPAVGKRWFVTGTDTTSKFRVTADSYLYARIDTVGAQGDSIGRNIKFLYYYFADDLQ